MPRSSEAPWKPSNAQGLDGTCHNTQDEVVEHDNKREQMDVSERHLSKKLPLRLPQ